MPPLEFILALHDHQPVGNFEHVFEDVYRRAYDPFLRTLERHPRVKCVLHRSGVLWEWMERRHPEHLDAVAELVSRGQVELLSGAHYEPLLPAIPERDRRGQLDKLGDFLERRFGVRPRGAWIAERVWEPQLAESLVGAGIAYTILDDAHLEAAGIPESALDGWYLTDENAHVLGIFPIRRELRYQVPFASPDAVIATLGTWAAAPAAPGDAGPALAVLADDGEKFGAWPGTHARCYEEGWLDRFFELVESSAAWLRSSTLAECAARIPPRGRTDVPAGAYPEFEEWALDPESQRALQRLRARLGSDGHARRFLGGGSWRHFLVRYPESNWMHKRVLRASAGVARRLESGGTTPAGLRAREEVWRAQCNCAYWHGLFGGIYLPHLRAAVYGALLRAERWLAEGAPEPPVEAVDVDADGKEEIVLRSRELQAFVKPDAGGAIVELDDRLRGFNLIDIVARHEEAYHDAWRADGRAAALAVPLVYDAARRGACVEHVLAPDAQPEAFATARLPELADLAGRRFEWRLDGDGVRLERAAALRLPGTPLLHVEKHLRLQGAVLEARWTLWHDGDGAVSVLFGAEIVLNFLAGDAPDRYYDVPGHDIDDRRLRSSGAVAAVQRVDLVDEWLGLRVRLETDSPCDVWRAPIETLSSSETGPQRVFQGSALLFVQPVVLAAGARWTTALRWSVERT